MSVGVPVFNTDVRVVTDAGDEAGPREIGELVIAGPQIIPAYWQKPEETAKSLRNGELRTGDVGFMDEHGWFYLVDRAKDMIVASGFKVWPREVEEVLYLHPAVREAAVVGVPDPYRGETIKAVVSLKPGMHGDGGRDQGVRPRADGRLQIPALRRDHRRPAEDDQRQDHAPPPADGARDGGADARRGSGARAGFVSAAPRGRRGARGARSRRDVAAPEPRRRCRDSTSEALYERLRQMLAQLGDGDRFVDRDKFLAANEAYHAAVDRPGRERAPVPGVSQLRLRELLRWRSRTRRPRPRTSCPSTRT